MKKTIIIGAIIVFTINAFSQSVDVPDGVIYHKTSTENNKKAKQIIEQSIKSKDCKIIFESTVMIGPNLWKKYLSSKFASKSLMGIELNFKIPIEGEVMTRKGRIIKEADEFKLIWDYISNELQKNSKIRVPSKIELGYYWSIIAYDIEEPIFVLENVKERILFNLNPQNDKVVFLESL